MKLIPIKIMSLIELGLQGNSILLLLDKANERVLPINIGWPETRAIIMAIEKIASPRPLTHHILNEIINRLGAKIDQVVIDDLKKNTFHAKLYLSKKLQKIIIDCRPSDALALIAGTEKPLFIADWIMEKAAQSNPLTPEDIKKLGARNAKQTLKELELTETDIKNLSALLETARQREKKETNEDPPSV